MVLLILIIQEKYNASSLEKGNWRSLHNKASLSRNSKNVDACKAVPNSIKREILQICARLLEKLIKKHRGNSGEKLVKKNEQYQP